MKHLVACVLLLTIVAVGCSEKPKNDGESVKTIPTFVLEWSEYPSWSAIDVAAIKGFIDGDEGELGPIEEKYGVDIILKRRDYVQSLKEFANGQTDAVCVTNIDALNLSKGRPATAILPTSTSDGADGVLALNVEGPEGLKGKDIYGAEDSVSEYTVISGLEKLGIDPSGVTFKHMEPDAAALALQSSGDDARIQVICVWQPFLLQTQRNRPESKLIFDSTLIPLEIVDMVLVGNDSLSKEGGESFAKAVTETYYELNKLLSDPKEADVVTVAIGKKFSNLELDDMKNVLTKCKFFGTPDSARGVFDSEDWQKLMQEKVVPTSINVGIVKADEVPSIGFNDPSQSLNFTTKYLP